MFTYTNTVDLKIIISKKCINSGIHILIIIMKNNKNTLPLFLTLE